jgi:hypothetical protein
MILGRLRASVPAHFRRTESGRSEPDRHRAWPPSPARGDTVSSWNVARAAGATPNDHRSAVTSHPSCDPRACRCSRDGRWLLRLSSPSSTRSAATTGWVPSAIHSTAGWSVVSRSWQWHSQWSCRGGWRTREWAQTRVASARARVLADAVRDPAQALRGPQRAAGGTRAPTRRALDPPAPAAFRKTESDRSHTR